jgi:hypothetical protein
MCRDYLCKDLNKENSTASQSALYTVWYLKPTDKTQVQIVCTSVWTEFPLISKRLPYLFPAFTTYISIHISTSARECDLSLDQSTSRIFEVTKCREGKMPSRFLNIFPQLKRLMSLISQKF